ncbi:MAG TPA: aminopeptidase P family protein, partial [Firmicutes bacterium]|nr:aminopeptidase P family protein [Bacillota bacterium]
MKGAELAPRVEACCRFLREHELAAAVVVSPANMFYLTGMMLVPHERLAAVVVGVEGVLLLVLPELERERALEFVQPGQVLSWRDGENPITTLGNALRMLGLPSRVRLGVEKDSLTLALADGLRGEFPSIEFTDLSSLFSRLRAVKSPEEVERIRQACAITVSALQENLPWIRPGLTELEVAARLDLSLKMAGATGTAFGTQVLSGIRSALPHGQSSRKEI